MLPQHPQASNISSSRRPADVEEAFREFSRKTLRFCFQVVRLRFFHRQSPSRFFAIFVASFLWLDIHRYIIPTY
jgi:hypothetical protein